MKHSRQNLKKKTNKKKKELDDGKYGNYIT